MKFVLALLVSTLAMPVLAQDSPKPDKDMKDCPMHAEHMKQSQSHYNNVKQRGEAHEGMGFSQTETTHHFILTNSGGMIQVTANDPKDEQSISQIQEHLIHIAGMFSKGDFSIPHFVHDQTPPGVTTMKKLKHQIHYTSETLPNGARVKIESKSVQAIEAVHDFLRFQIEDHQTGDPVTISANAQ
ncbi:MAG TPA: hypothetical protein VFP40_08940 [Terriglobales bacterium]|jgi:hypothetical protein|nr:hypothetical protein [Terriglobales bacterium]